MNLTGCSDSPAQVLSENHSGVLKLAEGFRDSLVSLKREAESLRKLKGELGRELTPTGKHAQVTPGTHRSSQLIVAMTTCVLSCPAKRLQ